MTEEIIKLEDVWVYYDGVLALEAVSLSIKQQDFLGIIGPNGGGKTTLLKVILGLLKPNRGKVTLLGNPPEKTRKFIGYVPQHSLFERDFPISVWEVVLTGRSGQRGMFRQYVREDKELAHEVLKEVGMIDFKDRQIGKLSGGEQQRIFIARALVTEPKILLLDEPTASVDTSMQAEFYDILERLKQRMAIVLVSHDIGAVSTCVNKIACLNRRLFYHGSKEISPEELEAVYQCPVDLIAHGIPHRVLREHHIEIKNKNAKGKS
ncbi:MAG: ABC transporter [Chloroflexi bacterium CG_4_9_14_3_um_filter_45_9]|nr:MAG: ABC transporter [Dehalococcoidia bacterium CG2_30_46_9]PIP08458.1 MAG: ABC transporter [Syntrophobacterales bacterium CG23_combo_of_CG06-09_8_20_14_all_48_27]PIU23311.1 MAG: ABC transporter [Chloroflexi bacterium CG08_land_8_20_14_0_20_45_12]PIX26993.1 MAG: ABC transporter [Chloroflexi bacterium CG_4_8_14_3_um_filter_45_15]PJB47566.1 MAG: ABC transporter [Chloroflexi bacterium CG_4_9_14_3_um_filter_45_9]